MKAQNLFVVIADAKVSYDSESSGIAEHVVRYSRASDEFRNEVARFICQSRLDQVYARSCLFIVLACQVRVWQHGRRHIYESGWKQEKRSEEPRL